jgi:hypothetical protein
MAMPRNVRVDDELWLSALAKARAEGTTLTAVVVSALRSYVTTPSMRAAAPATAVRPLEGARAPEPRPGTRPPQRRRCPHPGTRTIGGWCAPCGVVVETGWYLSG